MITRRILIVVACLSFVAVHGAHAASLSANRLVEQSERRSLVQQRHQARVAKLLHGHFASSTLKVVGARRTSSVTLAPTRAPLTVTAGLRSSASIVSRPARSAVSVSDTVERYRKEVLHLVNIERDRRGLGALSFHALLNDSAQRYAERMAEEHFFSHTDPEGNSSIDRIRATGYLQPPCGDCAWQYATGENLGAGQASPADVVKAWMDSPGHRANILGDQFDELGVGYADRYWVQHFGGIRTRD